MRIARRTVLQSSVLPFLLSRKIAASPARLKRQDCFFGLHFDLHPNKTDTILGRDVTDEMVDKLLAGVKPDFVQYDCKGHPGYMGYQSEVSTPAPGIVKDSLAIWRRVTAKHGVALFIHFSGLWDSLAVEQHPEWAIVNASGKPDDHATNPSGPYVDKRMIPELEEAARRYDLDGAWVDGECWAARLDYSTRTAEAFTAATGIRPLPKGPKDRGWQEFLAFNREEFRKYLRHYVDTLHKFRPQFQIASNWLYTTYVPEKPEVAVDFLSGDYLGNAAISAARTESRYLSAVGKPWDLMAWGFQRGSGNSGFQHKPAVQLQQEASVVIAQGGGFQVYYVPTRAGKIDDRHVAVMAKLAEFCRARQAISHKSESVPQIGVLFSKTSLYATTNKMFGGWGAAADPARGFVDALTAAHYSVDVIPEWRLAELASSYPLIVLPDWPDAGAAVKGILVRYVQAGGSLLIAGAANAKLFADVLQVKLADEPREQEAWIPATELFGNAHGLWQDVVTSGAATISKRFPTYDSSRDGLVAATLNPVGSGRIAAIYGPLGATYAQFHTPPIREFIRSVAQRMFTPMVTVDAPPTVDVVLRKKEGRLFVHLLNTTGMQVAGEYATSDFVPSVGPVRVSMKMNTGPKRVTFEPDGENLSGDWNGSVWTGAIARLGIHGIVAFEGGG